MMLTVGCPSGGRRQKAEGRRQMADSRRHGALRLARPIARNAGIKSIDYPAIASAHTRQFGLCGDESESRPVFARSDLLK
jgi:hypothetical protein